MARTRPEDFGIEPSQQQAVDGDEQYPKDRGDPALSPTRPPGYRERKQEQAKGESQPQQQHRTPPAI